MITRETTPLIIKNMFKGKSIIVLGPRQVGKTTLMHIVANEYPNVYLWLNADEPDIRNILTNPTSTALSALIGTKKLVILDEAQRIPNIGLTLKLLTDTFPDVQALVTGSSSFELAGEINEPLTGRKYEYCLYPLSFQEMVGHTSLIEEKRLLENRLIYGSYPEVVTNPGDARELISMLSDSYLYKDVLSYDRIKKPGKIERLLQALALQVGNEVRYHEVGQLIGADNETVERYINILEKAFIVFRLTSLARNMRNEIKKGRKIYFFDNGIRNSIIKNFSPLSLRQDTGALWENYLVSERIKHNHYRGLACNYFFWRTHGQQEIDFIEEREGTLHAYEFKWNAGKTLHAPGAFMAAYPGSKMEFINRENYPAFLLDNRPSSGAYQPE